MSNQAKNVNVLFIGNSYTFFNELWLRFQKLAESEGHSVFVDSVTTGGYTLSQMNNPLDKNCKLIDQKLAEKAFDYVVIQENSMKTVHAPEKFYHGVDLLAQRIRKAGAQPILYQTWGRKQGSEDLIKFDLTPKEMTELVKNAYQTAGKKFQIPVAPVGTAFYDVAVNHPEINLYHTDKTHPSAAGTYLAALCICATIFNISPLGVKYIFGVNYVCDSDKNSEHLILQEAAHRAFADKE